MLLSKRENEFALLTCMGDSRKEAANKLFIDVGTAKNHMNNIHRKTKTKNAVQLLHWYAENVKKNPIKYLFE